MEKEELDKDIGHNRRLNAGFYFEESMYKKFKENIIKYNLIEENSTIILGVSGGYDSMSLALCFLELRKEKDFQLIVAHINHMMRGSASDGDEAFVRDFCEKNSIKFFSHHEDMQALAQDEKISEEDAGRRIRYGFFHELADKYENSLIATGHNQGDQVETVLLNLIRGTGTRGLRGMDYKNGKIIRPILNISREEIQSFVDVSGWGHREDASNQESIYRRNSLRNQLIPFIEENYNPAFQEKVYAMTELIKEDTDLIESVIDESLQLLDLNYKSGQIDFDQEKFLSLDKTRQKHILRYFIEEINGSLSGFDKAHIEEFLGLTKADTGKFMSINSIVLKSEYGRIKVFKEEEVPELKAMKMGIKDMDFSFANYNISFRVLANSKRLKASRNTQYFDADLLKEINIRPRENGDRIRPFGFDGSKKLKDIFIDEKIPRDKRDSLPIFTDGREIIWVAGIRRSSLYTVKSSTKNIIKIMIEEKNGNL